jgi:hypothetical protein
LEQVADGLFFSGDDAVEESAAGARAAGDEDLFVEAGGGGGDVGKLTETSNEGTPVADAVGLDTHELDVGAGAEEAVLNVAAHAIGDGEGDDEGGDSGGDASDGDGGNDTDHGLTAFGAEVAGGEEELEAHRGQLLVISFQ